MHQAALRHRVREYRAQAVGQPRHAVHSHEQHALDAALAQLVEHAHPVVRALGLLHPQPEHVLAPDLWRRCPLRGLTQTILQIRILLSHAPEFATFIAFGQIVLRWRVLARANRTNHFDKQGSLRFSVRRN